MFAISKLLKIEITQENSLWKTVYLKSSIHPKTAAQL